MSQRIAHLQLHCAALLVGVSALFGESLNVSASMIVLGRAAFALLALSMICLCLNLRPWRGISGGTIARLLTTGVALGGHWILFFLAVKTGGVAVATLGFASFPAFTALLERLLFGQRLGRSDRLILLLVSAGLVLVTPSFDLRDGATEGLLWGVLSGASYAAIAVANKHVSSKVDGLSSCWWQCLAISVALLPWCLWELPAIGRHDWWQLAALGVLCTALAYSLFIASLRHVHTHTAAVVIAMEPIYAIAGAWLLFGSVPSVGMVLGGLLILGAVAWAGLKSKT
ncbi:drug/metabolite transporter (DMT)-like permease [Pseudomonas sp. BIGb0408]|uniref:Drug/metabolite transporter (DMT)-like permease n=1 Tax=Phytopseudomonas flavescens TaxID=29435 RepID=A0A7Y9XPK7_9GAMM|nr:MULTISPECIES: DMT family transporter [Pseudomonas]MCW2291575.1 drug/metabolite transporter (DMT)-like permease [Pseudomonas sp. BIGb0408]NYH73854.1 drug/metabolite transporter (DMT)-like permease [Pseudomonas flavescens]